MNRQVLLHGVVLAGACCALAGCSAGQVTQTQREVPDTPGIDATVGSVSLDDVYLQSAGQVPIGGSVPLRVAISADGPQGDRLVEVASPDAASVQVLLPDGRVSTGGLPIPGDGTVDATTGPVRFRVTGLTESLDQMGSLPVTFTFTHAGRVTLQVPAGTPTP